MPTLCRIVIDVDQEVRSIRTDWELDPTATSHRETLGTKPPWHANWPSAEDRAGMSPRRMALLRAEALLDFGVSESAATHEERVRELRNEQVRLRLSAIPRCRAEIVIDENGEAEWSLDVPATSEPVDPDELVAFIRNALRHGIKRELFSVS